MTQTHHSFATGVSLMVLSAIGLSLTGLFGKFGNQLFFLPALIFWRYGITFLFCFVLFYFKGSLRGFFAQRDYKLHLLRAFLVLLSQYCFYYYIRKNSLLNATVLLNLGPLFIPVIEWGILKKRVSSPIWIGVLVSLTGALLILQPDEGIFSFTSFIGLLSGISQGASQVVFGINAKTENRDLGVLNLFLLCCLFAFFPYLLMPESTWLAKPQWLWSICLLSLLAIASIANQLFRAIAYRHASPSKLASFLYVSVLFAGLWDWLIFDSPPNLLSIIGACLVLFGGALKILLLKVRSKNK